METCTWYDYATFCIETCKKDILLNLIKNVGVKKIEKKYFEGPKLHYGRSYFYCDIIFKHENGKCPELTEMLTLIKEYNLPIDVSYKE